MSGTAVTPLYRVSLSDETLIVGPDNDPVATTFQGQEDYDENYERRAADAEFLAKAGSLHRQAMTTLKDSYTALAFAFNRLHESSRGRDVELCRDFGRVRGHIEDIFRAAGEAL